MELIYFSIWGLFQSLSNHLLMVTIRASSMNIFTVVKSKATELEIKNYELLFKRTAFQKGKRAPAQRRQKYCIVVMHDNLNLSLLKKCLVISRWDEASRQVETMAFTKEEKEHLIVINTLKMSHWKERGKRSFWKRSYFLFSKRLSIYLFGKICFPN